MCMASNRYQSTQVPSTTNLTLSRLHYPNQDAHPVTDRANQAS
uniref:Uncharacterized protein n=1 Tax=Arundo donax TaxID=35708 RepID=A0A0A9PMK5_ARUDO